MPGRNGNLGLLVGAILLSAMNILCANLSLAILVGLAANAVLGLWWADPLVAVIVAIAAIQTGIRTWRGEACDDLTC